MIPTAHQKIFLRDQARGLFQQGYEDGWEGWPAGCLDADYQEGWRRGMNDRRKERDAT